MNAKLESVAARAANGWQRAGAKFDFEVFAMPGGSVLAPALWVYSMVSSALQRSPRDPGIQTVSDAGASQQARDAEAHAAAPGLRCDWTGCHCT